MSFDIREFARILLAIALTAVFLFTLAFTFRDTVREFLSVFDLSILKRFIRSLRNYRPRFSLATLLIVMVFAAPVAAMLRNFVWPENVQACLEFVLLFGMLAFLTVPLIVLFFGDAFGPSSRQRIEKYLHRHKFDRSPLANEMRQVDREDN